MPPARPDSAPPRAPEKVADILLVDDDKVFRERMARALRERGYDVVAAADGDEAIRLASACRFDFAIVDVRMPGRSGLDLLDDLRRLDAAIRVVLLTGYGSIGSAVAGMRRGAFSYLAKPADADELIRAMGDDTTLDAGAKPPTLALVEWEHIQRILADCGGNISESARRLGITRRTLQLKLKRHPPRA